MSAKHKWIAAICGLLIGNLIAMVLLIFVANGGSRSQVLPSYRGVVEQKGVIEQKGVTEQKGVIENR
jgi:uncharacterized PurR-regulated membrane protein YhhQ (DUF165 family)